MPATVTHYLVGEKAIEKLNITFDKTQREAFDLGCQGGDIFFFYDVLGGNKYPLLKKAGSVLHKKLINAPIHYMAEFASSLPDKEKKILNAYIMGYLCHFSTDTTAHPYIYGLSDILEKEKNVDSDSFYYHARIESNLDTIMLLKLKDKTILELPPYSLFPKESEAKDILASGYSYAFEKAGYVKVGKEEYKKAFSCFGTGLRLLYSKGSLKRDFIYKASKIIKITTGFSQMIHPVKCDEFCDYINISGREIQYNNNEKSKDNFYEIFEKAVEKSVNTIEKFLSGEKIPKIMEGRSFDNGLTVDYWGI